jgi:hypothetical protein
MFGRKKQSEPPVNPQKRAGRSARGKHVEAIAAGNSGSHSDAETEESAGLPRERSPDDAEKKQKRTTGLKLFDAFLYPFFTNFVVFGISLVATYLTAVGDKKDPETGELLYGKVGEFFQKRGKWLTDKFESAGLSHDQADMAKIVFFSFADGSLIAPFVKLLEDRREKIAKGIDKLLGTKPDDESVYTAEPKQSWFSVLTGRLATVSIVVPVAILMDKLKINGKNLNQIFFKDPGLKVGEHIQNNPDLAKHFGKHDISELSKIGFFEAFYTSVCTLGLYLSSRFIARATGGKKDNDDPKGSEAFLPPAEQTGELLDQGDSQQAGVERAPTRKTRPAKAADINSALTRAQSSLHQMA